MSGDLSRLFLLEMESRAWPSLVPLIPLQIDSVCGGENWLVSLGITPTAVESVVPAYLTERSHRRQDVGATPFRVTVDRPAM